MTQKLIQIRIQINTNTNKITQLKNRRGSSVQKWALCAGVEGLDSDERRENYELLTTEQILEDSKIMMTLSHMQGSERLPPSS